MGGAGLCPLGAVGCACYSDVTNLLPGERRCLWACLPSLSPVYFSRPMPPLPWGLCARAGNAVILFSSHPQGHASSPRGQAGSGQRLPGLG